MSLPPATPQATALVTGASSGIGFEIARELAARGHGVTLVARREDRLRELAGELTAAHGVRAEALACDLTDAAARDELPGRIEALGLTVEILVNNAGFGTGGAFHKSPADDEVRQVRLLCEAPVALLSAFLPGMVERRRGAVLNVASTAGMQPLPYSAGYAAAKAHALSLSEALHHEVRRTGVTVTALCPGPVRTEFFEVAGSSPIESSPGFMWEDVADVARAAVDGLEAGKRVVVPGLPMRTLTGIGRYVPNALKLRGVALQYGRRSRST